MLKWDVATSTFVQSTLDLESLKQFVVVFWYLTRVTASNRIKPSHSQPT